MTKIVLVEDSDADAAHLTECISRYYDATGAAYTVEHFKTGISFLDKYTARADLVFLDIELPDGDGLSVARKLRKLDGKVAIVFVTNMAQFAVNGYEVNAFDFIVKPVKYPVFAIKMQRIDKMLSRTQGKTVTIKTESGVSRRGAEEVKYVEIANHSLIWHLEDGEEITARGTMKEVEEMLAGAGFCKCNRCYLVNVRHITKISGSTVTLGADEVQISRPRRKEFLTEVAKYFGEGVN